MNWARILAYVTGTVDQELLLRKKKPRCAGAELSRFLRGHPSPLSSTLSYTTDQSFKR
jgi:hypothetical protein